MSVHVFDKELPAALARAQNLPSLPAVALEVLRISQDEDASLDDMASCLSRDPALAAKLLKLANSSLFGGGKAVTTLQRATMLLGMKTVNLMALSFSLAGSLQKNGRLGSFDFGEYWHRSLVNAIAARSLARLVKCPQSDEAFLCGLFGHFGKLVLARCLPDEFEAMLAEAGRWPSPEQEERGLGFRSTDVCATLLKSWHLPELLYVTVGSWSRPTELAQLADPAQRQLAQLLALAHLAEVILCEADKGDALARLQQAMSEQYGVSVNELDSLLMGLEVGIKETAELLAIKLPDGTSHEDVLEQARQQMMSVGLDTFVDLAAAQRRNQELESEKKVLESRASIDGLTGLPNRAAFDAFLEGEVRPRVADSAPHGVGLIMLDVDHFKRFNDTYGHQVGDEVLRRVGALLQRMTRKGDLSARYGGEEFVVVLPRTTPAALAIVANRLRKAVEDESLEVNGQRLSVTVSLGAVSVPRLESAAAAAALLKLADQCLYQAKRKGRNRCEFALRPEPPARS
ncbi:MAG: GGDEF domain-containing protein [Planctomycetes bacterium]|nr:GGDEF domain-containing protein [Planctomycetota bacterium]